MSEAAMEGFDREVLSRVPLAEGVLVLLKWVLAEEHLARLFDTYRGRAYEKIVTFAVMVNLVLEALIQHGGSGRSSFERARRAGELGASIQAAFTKLGRMPVELSMGLLAECTDRMADLIPEDVATPQPDSLQGFEVVVLDGKAIKRVAKRLKLLRGVKGGLLGGRALVAMSLRTGLAIAMHADPDGDANDVKFVPWLLPEVRDLVTGIRLWLADRAFCNLEQVVRFCDEGDHFLVRRRTNVRFEADPARSAASGCDDEGRSYIEAWGWLGGPEDPRRMYVRQVTLQRPGEEPILLITDLLDFRQYPATDLLFLYLRRWGIERMFQQVTEVFGLEGLIGSTPQAALFQFALCLILHNVVQVARAYVAAARPCPTETISGEKLFEDVKREMTACSVMLRRDSVVAGIAGFSCVADIRIHLHRLFGPIWNDRWLKTRSYKRRRHPVSPHSRSHSSVYRILRDAGQAARSPA
jgi:hypothetical protein